MLYARTIIMEILFEQTQTMSIVMRLHNVYLIICTSRDTS